MTTVMQDVRYAFRALMRRRVFTAVVLATIALGVGANTAIFSVVNGILLRPLPYPHPERLVSFGHNAPTWLTSQPEYLDYKRDLRSFESLAAYVQNEGNLATDEEPERIALASVTLDFFSVLGRSPMIGRTRSASCCSSSVRTSRICCSRAGRDGAGKWDCAARSARHARAW